MSDVNFPFGAADQQTITDAATSTVTVTGSFTVLSAGTISQAITALSISAVDKLPIGSRLQIDIQQGGTGRNVSFGSAGDTIVAPNLTGVANDRDIIELVWNGTDWVAVGAWFKVVDAA